MTTSGNDPAKYDTGPRTSDGDEHEQRQHQDERPIDDTELASPGGYDDRQESLEEADRDLFERKDNENPEARYRPQQHPLSEPRKQED